MAQEAQAANIANTIIQVTATLYGIEQQINQLASQWTNLSVATKLNNFPTAPLTATGALGTADGTAVVTDPIDTRAIPGTLLTRPMSANNIASLLTYLQGVSAAIAGTAVSANGAAAQLVALCL